MNSAVIVNAEYKFPEQNEFSVLDIVPHSGKLNEDPKRSGSGMLYSLKADILIAGVSAEKNELMNSFNGRKATFRITDADGIVYLIGTENYAARMLATLDLGGSPGSFKGYRCVITYNSTKGCIVQNPV